jgi:hypothetical protein
VYENQVNSIDKDTKAPKKNKRSVNILFILILACWLLLLFVYEVVKGPG